MISSVSVAKGSRAWTITPKTLSPVISFCLRPSSLTLQSEQEPVTRPVARATLMATLQGFELAARSVSMPLLTTFFFSYVTLLPARPRAKPFGSASVE